MVISTFPQIEAKLGSLGRKIIYSWILSFLKNDFASNDSPFRKSVSRKQVPKIRKHFKQEVSVTAHPKEHTMQPTQTTQSHEQWPQYQTATFLPTGLQSVFLSYLYRPFRYLAHLPEKCHFGRGQKSEPETVPSQASSPDFRKQKKMVSLPKVFFVRKQNSKIHSPNTKLRHSLSRSN